MSAAPGRSQASSHRSPQGEGTPVSRWVDLPAPDDPVPERYRGVWVRTLLETPEGRDTTTRVHWLQTEGWHADLRVPKGAHPATPEGRAQLQGFCGLTRITPAAAASPTSAPGTAAGTSSPRAARPTPATWCSRRPIA